MPITVNLDPDLEARLRAFTTRTGQDMNDTVAELIEAGLPQFLAQPENILGTRPTTPPAWVSKLKPQEPGGFGSVTAPWPDDEPDETDEELLAALKAMDETKK